MVPAEQATDWLTFPPWHILECVVNLGSGWNGLLVVQDLQRETASLEKQAESEIKVPQAAELGNQLAQVLGQKS
jgi:hypothetical protein